MYPGVVINPHYFNGGAYEDYSKLRGSLFEDARILCGKLDELGILTPNRTNIKVGILGSGYGFTIEALRSYGIDAWGIELSAYAITQTKESIQLYTIWGNALVKPAMEALSKAALPYGGKFDVLIDENLSPLLTDEEAVEAANLWRQYGPVIHRISMKEEGATRRYRLENEGAAHNWHTPSEWRELLGPQDKIYQFKDWTEA